MTHDDDTLADIDLTAWEVPPPPAGLADAVLQRMGGTQVDVALPVETTAPPQRRRWLVAGVAAAAVLVVGVGAIVWSLAREAGPEIPASGEIVADRAQVLALDTARASLDPGADVRWRRERGRLLVEQRAGAATWHVERGEELVIAAGAGVASVKATGANLRVEVQMNATDARVIGASAVTAAAVSLVTVIVYEGHVKAGRGEQATVVVAPGTTYRIDNEDTRPVVGGSVVTVSREESNEDEEPRKATDGAKEQDEVDEDLIDLGPPPASTVPSALDRAAIQETMTKLRPSLSACDVHGGGRVVAKMRVAPNGKVIRANTTSDNAELAACVEPIVATARFPMTERGGAFDYPLVFPTATTCDAEALKQRGMEHVQVGEHAVALTLFEASLECKPDPYVINLAFMSACSSDNSAKAKVYYQQLSPQAQARLRQICVRQMVEYQ